MAGAGPEVAAPAGAAGPRLILFTGHAGTGKTTLARRLVARVRAGTGEALCLLDKDTVYGEYSSRVMGHLTGDPHDRDSPLFLDNFRDCEYAGLLAVARENLALGIGAVVCGPFSREVRARRLHDPAALGMPPGTPVTLVWVTVDEALAHRRIVERGDHRDRYKLAHWEAYRQRRFEPDPAEHPELIIFDNSAPGPAAGDRLIDRLARC